MTPSASGAEPAVTEGENKEGEEVKEATEEELAGAATKISAAFKGKRARREVAEMKEAKKQTDGEAAGQEEAESKKNDAKPDESAAKEDEKKSEGEAKPEEEKKEPTPENKEWLLTNWKPKRNE